MIIVKYIYIYIYIYIKHNTNFWIYVIIIIIISFMQGIYTYIPETTCVPREYFVKGVKTRPAIAKFPWLEAPRASDK